MTIRNETTEERNARIELEEGARDSYKNAMNSHNEEPDIFEKYSEVIDTIRKDVFKTLGVDPSWYLNRMQEFGITLESLSREDINMTFELNPAMCGPVAAMFEKISCKVCLGYNLEHDFIGIEYHYSYDHPRGGSNGFRVRRSFMFDKQDEKYVEFTP